MVIVTILLNFSISCLLIYYEYKRKKDFQKDIERIDKMHRHFEENVNFHYSMISQLIKNSFASEDDIKELIKILKKQYDF